MGSRKGRSRESRTEAKQVGMQLMKADTRCFSEVKRLRYVRRWRVDEEGEREKDADEKRPKDQRKEN